MNNQNLKTKSKVTCCYLTQLLDKINNSLTQNNLVNEPIIEIIWVSLEKEGKLCANCS